MVLLHDFRKIGGSIKLLPAASPGRKASPANIYVLEPQSMQATFVRGHAWIPSEHSRTADDLQEPKMVFRVKPYWRARIGVAVTHQP